MSLEDVPGRVFLDTCAVNFILDYGEQIHDGVSPPSGLGDRARADVDALYNIFLTGQRAMWQLAISAHYLSRGDSNAGPTPPPTA